MTAGPDAAFTDAAARLGYRIALADLEALRRLHALLEEANRTMALTRIEGWDGFLERHVLDSLTLARAIPAGDPWPASLIDIGSGAGFPALPLALLLPSHERARGPVRVTACESIAKKSAFIAAAADALGLGERLVALPERAEVLGRDPAHRDTYDLATARAVADLAVLVEVALPLVRPGGALVAFKGPEADREVLGAAAALDAVGGVVEDVVEAGLPGRALRLVRIRKPGPTPDRFPRRAGIAAKRPLT